MVPGCSKRTLPIYSSNWSCLPSDLLELVCSKLRYKSDLIRFKAICRSWQSTTDAAPGSRMPFFPIFCRQRDDYPSWNLCLEFVQMSSNNKKIFLFKNIVLPQKARVAYNFTQGWLVCANSRSKDIIVHPFSSSEPQIRFSKPNFSGLKVVASSNPLDANCIFVAIATHRLDGLVLKTAGDDKWQDLNPGRLAFADIIFYNNSFYALHVAGAVYVIYKGFRLIKIANTPLIQRICPCRYLVESSGNLLQVMVFWNKSAHPDFQISKLNFDTRQWDTVTSLGYNSLLLFDNCCSSVSTKDFPKVGSDCIIYYDSRTWYTKLFVFDLKTLRHEIFVEERILKLLCYIPDTSTD